MKLYLLGASVILLLASAFGLITAFSRPTQAAVPEKVTTLSYEQRGSFDYKAAVRPGAFYGNQATTEAAPQIPIGYIDSFDIDFSFTSDNAAPRLVAIDARLENPGVWAKTVNLVPSKPYTGSFKVSFPFDFASFQQLSDTINKEMGVSGTAYTVTITAAVSGDDGFTQSLPVRVTKYLLDIGEELVMTRGGSTGKFDYRVKLHDNSLYGPVTITPPASLLNPVLTTLGPEGTILMKLLDSLNMSFSYNLSSDKAINTTTSRVIVTALLENPGVWSKTFVLFPETTFTGPVRVSFPVDVAYLSGLFDTIQKEAGVSGSCALIITASVHTSADTGAGPVEKDFTQSVKTDLKKSVLAWEGGLLKTEPGKIEASRVVLVDNKLLAFPVSQARVIFGVLAALALALFALAMLKTPITGQGSASEQLSSKYRDIIVEAGEMPSTRSDENVVRVNSLDDLIKTSQGLLKPVLHRAEDGKQMYWISDGGTRYQYMEVVATRKKAGRGT